MASDKWTLIKDAVLFVIAVYGALLSTFNWRQALKRDSRQITVTASSAMPTYGRDVGPPFAKLEAVNTGQRAVTIKTIAFQLSSGARINPMQRDSFPLMADTELPATLTDGQSAHFFISYAAIGDVLLHHGHRKVTKLIPVAIDSANNVYKGEPWDVDPQEFVTMH